MKLEQLSFSVESKELSSLVNMLVAQVEARGALPGDVSNPKVSIEKGHVIISIQKKMGFMPVTLSMSIGLRPAPDGQGIVVTLAKVSAGFIGSEGVASMLMGEVGRSLANVPGCSVSGNDITISKTLLASRVPWLTIPGAVKACDINGSQLTFTIG